MQDRLQTSGYNTRRLDRCTQRPPLFLFFARAVYMTRVFTIQGLYASELPSCVVTGMPVHKRDLIQVNTRLIRSREGRFCGERGGLAGGMNHEILHKRPQYCCLKKYLLELLATLLGP